MNATITIDLMSRPLIVLRESCGVRETDFSSEFVKWATESYLMNWNVIRQIIIPGVNVRILWPGISAAVVLEEAMHDFNLVEICAGPEHEVWRCPGEVGNLWPSPCDMGTRGPFGISWIV